MHHLAVRQRYPAFLQAITAVSVLQFLAALSLISLELCGSIGRLATKWTFPLGLMIASFALVLDVLTEELLASFPQEEARLKNLLPFLAAITLWWASLFAFMHSTMGKRERKAVSLVFCLLFGGYFNLSHGLSYGYRPPQERFRGSDALMLAQAAVFCYCSWMDDGEELYSYLVGHEWKKQKCCEYLPKLERSSRNRSSSPNFLDDGDSDDDDSDGGRSAGCGCCGGRERRQSWK